MSTTTRTAETFITSAREFKAYRAALSAADEAGRAYIKELQDAGHTAEADRVSAEVDAICEARAALPRLFAGIGTR